MNEAAKNCSTAMLAQMEEKPTGNYNMLFDALTQGKDGHISVEEFGVYLIQVDRREHVGRRDKWTFNTIDVNGNVEISREEILAALRDFFFGLEEAEFSNALYGHLLQ